MRVAFVLPETTRHREHPGAARLERVAGLLADRGHDVTVFCAQWWNDYSAERIVDGVRYRGLTVGTATASFASRLPVALARVRPDVIHARLLPARVTLAAAAGSALARAPLLAEQFGTDPIEGRLGRAAVRAADRIVVPSELVRTAVRERGASEADTAVIPESIAYPEIEATDPNPEIDVAYAHRLDETANLEALLLALAELRTLGWTATIVGDGPQRAAYERQAEKLRIDDRVRFLGAPDRRRRLAVYRSAHAFVQTATRSVFPTELLWALAAGCVGIVEYHAESSAHELIESYDRSFRVTDTATMAAAIESAGELERRTVDDRWRAFDHGRVIEQYTDLYGALTGGERSREPVAVGDG